MILNRLVGANSGFDFGGFKINEPNMEINLNEILHQSIEPEVNTPINNTGAFTSNQKLVDINTNIENSPNSYYNEYQKIALLL